MVRVNSILCNSESKILEKFYSALDLKGHKSDSVEMIERTLAFFKEERNRGMCLVFILEDIDFYIANTKQIMLYKILDMLQYIPIPFVFIATS
jgi:hypothetical protein